MLQRSRRDIKIHNAPMEVMKRVDFFAKQQNSLKGLKFGDRQNCIDHPVGTGVSCESIDNHMSEVMQLSTQPEESAEEAESMNHDPNQNPSRAIEIDGDESMEEGDKDEEVAEDDAKDKDEAKSEDDAEVIADGKEDASEKTSVEIRDDENGTPGAAVANEKDHATRHGRVSRTCERENDFPET